MKFFSNLLASPWPPEPKPCTRCGHTESELCRNGANGGLTAVLICKRCGNATELVRDMAGEYQVSNFWPPKCSDPNCCRINGQPCPTCGRVVYIGVDYAGTTAPDTTVKVTIMPDGVPFITPAPEVIGRSKFGGILDDWGHLQYKPKP